MPLVEESVSVNFINRQFYFSVNVDTPSDYFYKAFVKVHNSAESVLTVRFLNTNVYTINSNIFLNINGTPETDAILRNIFDNIPDYFASIEEETEI